MLTSVVIKWFLLSSHQHIRYFDMTMKYNGERDRKNAHFLAKANVGNIASRTIVPVTHSGDHVYLVSGVCLLNTYAIFILFVLLRISFIVKDAMSKRARKEQQNAACVERERENKTLTRSEREKALLYVLALLIVRYAFTRWLLFSLSLDYNLFGMKSVFFSSNIQSTKYHVELLVCLHMDIYIYILWTIQMALKDFCITKKNRNKTKKITQKSQHQRLKKGKRYRKQEQQISIARQPKTNWTIHAYFSSCVRKFLCSYHTDTFIRCRTKMKEIRMRMKIKIRYEF